VPEDAISSAARFRSYSSDNEGVPSNVTILAAARATSAATGYFEPMKVGQFGERFIDGAFRANNPIDEVWEEARDIWSLNNDNIAELVKCCVSIGTGASNPHRMQNRPEKLFTATMPAIVTETETTAARFRARHSDLFAQGRCFRFNVQNGLKEEVAFYEYKRLPLVVSATDAYLRKPEVQRSLNVCAEKLTHKEKSTSSLYHIYSK